MLSKATVGIIALGLVCSLGVMVLGEPVLVLVYGSKMSGFGYLLFPLVFLSLVTGYMWFINDLLMAIRNFRATFLGNIVALVLSIACLPFILKFEMDGVTFACIVSSLGGTVFMLGSLLMQLHINWES